MLPAYNYMEYISPSGNIWICIVQKKEVRLKLSKKKKDYVIQKLLGTAMAAMGIFICIIFPQDCGAGVIAFVMGILRILF